MNDFSSTNGPFPGVSVERAGLSDGDCEQQVKINKVTRSDSADSLCVPVFPSPLQRP